MRIVFASPGFHYQSYYDLHNVFSNCGIRHAKFPTMLDEPDTAYVYTPANGELDGWYQQKNRKSKLFWWFLERIEPNGYSGFKRSFDNREWDGIIVSDYGYYLKMKELGINVVFCPVGYHQLFGIPNFHHHKVYDFAHMSYDAVWRRTQFYSKLQGYNIAPNGWGDERRDALYGSRFLLNTHQDETKAIEPLRLMMAVAHGIPILSERCDYIAPYDRHPCIMHQATIGDLSGLVEHAIGRYKKEPHLYIGQAIENFMYFSQHCKFFEEVEKAVKVLLGQ